MHKHVQFNFRFHHYDVIVRILRALKKVISVIRFYVPERTKLRLLFVHINFIKEEQCFELSRQVQTKMKRSENLRLALLFLELVDPHLMSSSHPGRGNIEGSLCRPCFLYHHLFSLLLECVLIVSHLEKEKFDLTSVTRAK